MKQTVKRMIVALYAVLAFVVLGFGTAEAVTGFVSHCDDPENGYIGECPPYDQESCEDDCHAIFGSHRGDCLPKPGGSEDCCLCQL